MTQHRDPRDGSQPTLAHTALEDVVRDQFGRAAWTHKTFEKTADIHTRRAIILKWLEVGLLAVTTGSAVSAVLGTAHATTATAVLSSAALLVTLGQLKLNPEQEGARAGDAARRLWVVRESYYCLLADMQDGRLSADSAAARRDALVQETAAIYQAAPRPLPAAYRKASGALKQGEELTFTTEEIDRLLPPGLRRAAPAPQPASVRRPGTPPA